MYYILAMIVGFILSIQFNIVLLHIGRKHLEKIQSNCTQIVKLIDKFCGNIILQVTCF